MLKIYSLTCLLLLFVKLCRAVEPIEFFSNRIFQYIACKVPNLSYVFTLHWQAVTPLKNSFNKTNCTQRVFYILRLGEDIILFKVRDTVFRRWGVHFKIFFKKILLQNIPKTSFNIMWVLLWCLVGSWLHRGSLIEAHAVTLFSSFNLKIHRCFEYIKEC